MVARTLTHARLCHAGCKRRSTHENVGWRVTPPEYWEAAKELGDRVHSKLLPKLKGFQGQVDPLPPNTTTTKQTKLTSTIAPPAQRGEQRR